MGYYNTIRMATTKEGFAKLVELVGENEWFDVVDNEPTYETFDHIDIIEDEIIFGWDSIKWNDIYGDTAAVMKAMEEIWEADEYPLLFVRIGEEAEDNEFDRGSDPRLNTEFYIRREIDYSC